MCLASTHRAGSVPNEGILTVKKVLLPIVRGETKLAAQEVIPKSNKVVGLFNKARHNSDWIPLKAVFGKGDRLQGDPANIKRATDINNAFW